MDLLRETLKDKRVTDEDKKDLRAGGFSQEFVDALTEFVNKMT